MMPPEISRRTLLEAVHPSASEASRDGPAYHAATPVDHGVLVLAQSTVRKGPAQAFRTICRATHCGHLRDFSDSFRRCTLRSWAMSSLVGATMLGPSSKYLVGVRYSTPQPSHSVLNCARQPRYPCWGRSFGVVDLRRVGSCLRPGLERSLHHEKTSAVYGHYDASHASG